MFVANKALDVGEQCLPFAAVIGAGGGRGGGQSRNDDEDERKEICTINSLN